MNRERRKDLTDTADMLSRARPMLYGAFAIVRDCLTEERVALEKMGTGELYGIDPRVTASVEAIQNLEAALDCLDIDRGPLPAEFWIREAVA